MRNTIRILGIDPGTGKLGWNIIEYDLTTKTPMVSRFNTLKGNIIYTKTYPTLPDNMTRRFTIIEGMQRILEELITLYKPDVIAIEDTFFNPTRPQAYQALTLVIAMVERVSCYMLGKPIYRYPPQEVKKIVTQQNTLTKHTVQETINSMDIIVKNSKQASTDNLDEHSLDSIAVGLAFIMKDLPIILADNPGFFNLAK